MEVLMNERIQGLIGRCLITQAGKVRPVEKTAIQRYCESSSNLNPLYLDEEYAKNGPYEGIVAPQTFFWVPFRTCAGEFGPVPQGTDIPDVVELMELLQLWRALDAGEETEFFARVHPSDLLTYDRRIANIVEKKIKFGPALLVTIRTTVTNQKGELVCINDLEFFFF
jgi:acyl dehydratase